MRTIKAFIITILAMSIVSCNDTGGKKSNLSIAVDAKNNVLTLGDTVKLSVLNPNGLDISSITYHMDDSPVEASFLLDDEPLGTHKISASVSVDGTEEIITTKITVLNNQAPKVYDYKIINTYPHDITSYTQGLEFHNGELYESTGQYGESKLRKVDYKTGEVLKNIDLAQQYFAEGITIKDNRIYQLTWRELIGFVYDVDTFEKKSSFSYGQSKEGWGLCNNGDILYKSDGTENIWLLNPETLAEESHIQAFREKGKVSGLNELEWVEGKIYANIYQYNGVAIINPANGAVEGVVNFEPLHKLVTQHQGLDVLNGIAYHPESKTLFITGKRWDKLFEVEIFEK